MKRKIWITGLVCFAVGAAVARPVRLGLISARDGLVGSPAENRLDSEQDELRRDHIPSGPIYGYVVNLESPVVGEPVLLKIAALPSLKNGVTATGYRVLSAENEAVVRVKELENGVFLEPKHCSSHKTECKFDGELNLSTSELIPGAYYVQIKSEEAKWSEKIQFNVLPRREEVSSYDVVVIAPTFTWQAYNVVGGGSFYRAFPLDRHFTVSLQRPYTTNPFHAFSSLLSRLKKQSHSYFVISDYDFHNSDRWFKDKKLVVIGDHHEYWSQNMRDHMEKYLGEGGRLAVFGGNICWWKINVVGSQIHVNKAPKPTSNPLFANTGKWSSKTVNQPEESLIGMSYRFAGYPVRRKVKPDELAFYDLTEVEYANSSGMKVANSRHPLFEGTRLRNGDFFGIEAELIKVEIDGLPLWRGDLLRVSRDKATAIPKKIKVLATALTYNPSANPSKIHEVATIAEHLRPGGGVVVHLGSIGWTGALKKANDPILKKIFDNTVQYLLRKKKVLD